MLEMLSILFFIYICVKLYTSVMQIGFIASEKRKEPILMLPSKYIKSANHAIGKEKLNIIDTLIEYGLFLFWVSFGFSYLESILAFESPILASVIYLLLFIVINAVVVMPLNIYQTFVLDKKFGFTTMSPKLFIKDTFISLAMLAVFGSLVIAVVSYIIVHLNNWWIWGFVFIFGVIILVNMIYPTLIAPFFNKFTPLEDGELKSKIEALMGEAKLKSNGVFVMDASKRDNRLNAYFGGLGSTKRVVLFDTLIKKLSNEELLAVLGHELGHFLHKDLLKNIAMMALIIFALFFIFGHLPLTLFSDIGFEVAPYSIMALFMLLSPIFMFFAMPLMSFVSRHNEFQADENGAKMVSKSDLISALIKLVEENKSFPKSHPLYIFFYYSHPPILERLKALGYEEHKKDETFSIVDMANAH